MPKVTPLARAALSMVCATGLVFAGSAAAATVQSADPGATPFISFVTLNGVNAQRFTQATFSVRPMAGSTTTPVSATYTRRYLLGRGYLDSVAGTVRVPVFGLYADSANTVTVTYSERGQARQTFTVPITTAASNASWEYNAPTVITPRDNAIPLNFSYFMVRNWGSGPSPVIMDTDGRVRWVGTSGVGSPAYRLYLNGIYTGAFGSPIARQELDGTWRWLADYTSAGVTNTGHHNFDLGRRGILVEVDRTNDVESAILEIDGAGNVIDTFDMNQIFADEMIAHGDNPYADPNGATQEAVYGFVRPRGAPGDDWFHNNSATYWRSQNTLVVSSRENFVVGIDYTTKKIKWILGDQTKAWYTEYPSLRRLALRLTGTTTAPVGQHAVSITAQGELMLFDNGLASFQQWPTGPSRDAAHPRRYRIDARHMTATEVWSFDHVLPIYSPICSSVYESGSSRLVDYASAYGGPILVGLGSRDRIAFEYQIPGDMGWAGSFWKGWNADPTKLSGITYDDPSLAPGPA
jgi:hypothetical protein